MTGGGWVSIIALTAWLVLALSAFRSRRVPVGKALFMAAMWGGIFLLVAAIFTAAGS